MKTLNRKTLTRRSLGLLLALLLHGLGLAVFWQAYGTGQAKARPELSRLTVNLIAVAPQALAPRAAQPPPQRQARPKARVAPAAAMTAPTTSTAEVTLPDLSSLAEAPAQPAALSPSAAGSAPSRGISQESIQRAIRQHLAQAPMRPDPGPRTTATERFGQEVQQAAVGDCLKGEFLGGGAGLLSAPFWLLAEARGKCRR